MGYFKSSSKLNKLGIRSIESVAICDNFGNIGIKLKESSSKQKIMSNSNYTTVYSKILKFFWLNEK